MGKDKGSGIGSIYYNRQREKWNAQYTEYDAVKDDYVVKTKSFKTKEEATDSGYSSCSVCNP